LGRNLTALSALIDISLAQARLEAGTLRRQDVALSELVDEVALAATMQANSMGLALTVAPVPLGFVIHVDRQLLVAALANIIQNALKFTWPKGQIVLRTDTLSAPDRVLIEVEDECGGLPPGATENL